MGVLDVEISRGRFLKGASIFAAGLVIGSYAERKDSSKLVLHPEKPQLLNPDINVDFVCNRMRVVVDDFSKVYGLSLDAEKIVSQVNLITSKEEFLSLKDKRDDTYGQGDEEKELFFVVDERKASDKRIQVNGVVIETLIKKKFGAFYKKEYIEDFVDYVLGFALADYSSPGYVSPQFKKVVSASNIYGSSVEEVYVDGATLKVDTRDQMILMLNSLERFEALLIGHELYTYMLRHGDIPLDTQDSPESRSVALYDDLLRKVFGNLKRVELIKKLVEIRSQLWGREEYFKMIQKAAGRGFLRPSQFPLRVFSEILAGDKKAYIGLMENG